VINTLSIPCDLIDALFLSPAVHQQLSSDALSRLFVINDDYVDPSDFSILQQLIRGETIAIPSSSRRSLVFLCRNLCNPEFEYFFAALSPTNATASLSDLLTPRPRDRIDDISLLSFDALDELLSRDSIQLESEDFLLKHLIELGPKYRPLLRHVRFEFLSVEGLGYFADQCFWADVTEGIWKGVMERLRRSAEMGVQKTMTAASKMVAVPRLDSRIISDFPSLFSEFTGKSFRLLYRGSRDGFRAADFHGKCDGHGNTLTVILDRNRYVFGGYTPLEWESRERAVNDTYKCDESLKGFVFTLKNPHNTTAKKFSLKADKKRTAICCDPAFGPTFGVYDLLVADSCNANSNSHTMNLGLTYNNYTGLDGKTFFTGSTNFRVKEIEVFEIAESDF
jgi:hypothetical protein